MRPDELWDTTMDRNNRILEQITLEDAGVADLLFDILMGTEVEPRRNFIVEKAHYADLDLNG